MEVIREIAAAELSDCIKAADNAIVLYHKELCPHCKNMEKVLAKFSKKAAGVEFYGVDSNEEPIEMDKYGVERVPSLLFVKNGEVVHCKTGLMNPKELAALYSSL